MDAPIWVDLTKSYSVEFVVNRERVDYYKSFGVEELLKLIESPITGARITVYDEESDKKLEFIDGCHRSRALLELGVSACRVSRFGKSYFESDILLRKTSNVFVLENKGYDFFMEMTELSYDIYEFMDQQGRWPEEFNPFLFEFHNWRYDL